MLSLRSDRLRAFSVVKYNIANSKTVKPIDVVLDYSGFANFYLGKSSKDTSNILTLFLVPQNPTSDHDYTTDIYIEDVCHVKIEAMSPGTPTSNVDYNTTILRSSVTILFAVTTYYQKKLETSKSFTPAIRTAIGFDKTELITLKPFAFSYVYEIPPAPKPVIEESVASSSSTTTTHKKPAPYARGGTRITLSKPKQNKKN